MINVKSRSAVTVPNTKFTLEMNQLQPDLMMRREFCPKAKWQPTAG